jgi:hypothetical protein
MRNHIQYITRKEINITKWNECIDQSFNGLIYAHSFFLDELCTNWDALVMNDYEAVMPLPWRKKWNFQYIYQPYFIAALGVFGNNLTSFIIESFLNHIPKKFSFLEIDINETNQITSFPELAIKKRQNQFLILDKPYETLLNNYKRLAKRKLQTAVDNGLVIQQIDEAELVISSYEKYYEEKNRIIPHETYTRLLKTISSLPKKNYQSYLVQKQETIAGFYTVLVDEKNVYSIIGGSTTEGKNSGAFYLATDAAIKDHSGTGKTFRFEGSDIEGIAFFNQQFGSFPVDYLRLKMNKLPWPFLYFK